MMNELMNKLQQLPYRLTLLVLLARGTALFLLTPVITGAGPFGTVIQINGLNLLTGIRDSRDILLYPPDNGIFIIGVLAIASGIAALLPSRWRWRYLAILLASGLALVLLLIKMDGGGVAHVTTSARLVQIITACGLILTWAHWRKNKSTETPSKTTTA